MDFLEANAIVAALEQRERTLESHRQNGVQDNALELALAHTRRACVTVRAAFRLTDEAVDAAHEAATAALDDLIRFDPELGSPDPVRIEDVPLALLTYQAEGR
jgi:hypothetical protein